MTSSTFHLRHAWTTVDQTDTSVTRECICGWVTIGTLPEPDHHTPLTQRESDHLRDAAAIEDGTVWDQIPPVHSYQLHLQRRLRAQTPNHVVITAVWWGGSQQVLIFDWNREGLAAAQRWCDEHHVVWARTGYPVERNSLAVHADAV